MLGFANPRPRGGTARTLRDLACVLGAATLAGACAPAGGVEPTPSPWANGVVVHNNSWDRVTLYLARRGAVWRLGELEGMSNRSFPLPRWARGDVDDVYFVARRLAGRTFRSESFVLPSGSTAVWTIESQPSLTHVALRR